MVQRSHGSSFALKTVAEPLRGNLDGHFAPQPRVESPPHFSHAAGAEHGPDFVWPQLLTSAKLHWYQTSLPRVYILNRKPEVGSWKAEWNAHATKHHHVT